MAQLDKRRVFTYRSMERSIDRRFEPRGSRREFFSVKISLTILRCKAEGKSLERLTALCNPMCLGGLNRAKQFYSQRVIDRKCFRKKVNGTPRDGRCKQIEITTRVVPWQPEEVACESIENLLPPGPRSTSV